MLRRVLILPVVAALLAPVGCSGAKSTPPSSLEIEIPKAAASGGGKPKPPPPPPTGRAD